jgi:hypothetical protein
VPTFGFEIPGLRLRTGLNFREHPLGRSSRVKREHELTRLFMLGKAHWAAWREMSRPLVVTITRFGPNRVDDDNLAAGCKAVRDAVARVLGIDDGDPQIAWLYKQEKARYKVAVDITSRAIVKTVIEELIEGGELHGNQG